MFVNKCGFLNEGGVDVCLVVWLLVDIACRACDQSSRQENDFCPGSDIVLCVLLVFFSKIFKSRNSRAFLATFEVFPIQVT